MANSDAVKRLVHEVMLVLSNPEELGLFGAIALHSVLQAGAEPGYRRLLTHPGFGTRLAPHRALRHRILMALLDVGVLAPVGSKRRLDDALCEASWEDHSLEDSDWTIVWDEVSRGSLAQRLDAYLDGFESTAGTRGILLDTWQALGVGECVAFGEYALDRHNLNPKLARSAAPVLIPLLGEHSIGQGCALMWTAAKNIASWFLRNGGTAVGNAERELVRSIHNYVDRAREGGQGIPQFSRHAAIPFSTLAGSFLLASRLGDRYWTVPLSETTLDRARPVDLTGDSDISALME